MSGYYNLGHNDYSKIYVGTQWWVHFYGEPDLRDHLGVESQWPHPGFLTLKNRGP